MRFANRVKCYLGSAVVMIMGFILTLALFSTIERPSVAHSLKPLPHSVGKYETAKKENGKPNSEGSDVLRPDDVIPYDVIPDIDGAITPERIPEETAQLHFLMGASTGHSERDSRKSRAYLRHALNLPNTTETASLVHELGTIARKYNDDLDLKFKMLTEATAHADGRRITKIKGEKQQLLAEFVRDVAVRLGNDGESRVQKALQYVKEHTRVFRAR